MIALTPRETEVAKLEDQGLSAKDIARKLGLSPKTVEFYACNILAKTESHSMREALHKLRGEP